MRSRLSSEAATAQPAPPPEPKSPPSCLIEPIEDIRTSFIDKLLFHVAGSTLATDNPLARNADLIFQNRRSLNGQSMQEPEQPR